RRSIDRFDIALHFGTARRSDAAGRCLRAPDCGFVAPEGWHNTAQRIGAARNETAHHTHREMVFAVTHYSGISYVCLWHTTGEWRDRGTAGLRRNESHFQVQSRSYNSQRMRCDPTPTIRWHLPPTKASASS